MRQRESIWGSLVRTLLLVVGLFVIVFGGYLPLLYPGQEQSVTLSIVFLISGIVLAFSGTMLGYRHQRLRAARRLAGTDPRPSGPRSRICGGSFAIALWCVAAASEARNPVPFG